MANKKGLFAILSDGTGAGVAPDNANPDTTLGSAITNTIASPAFINSSGVLVFPQLNPDGAILVSTEGAGTCYDGYAKVTGTTSFQDLGAVTGLTIGETYSQFNFSISAATEACIQLVRVDDSAGTPIETVMAEFMVGPGQYSYTARLHCLDADLTGGTGVQDIKLKGKLLESTGAEIMGWLGFIENAS